MQKTPGESWQNDGQDSPIRDAHQKANREHAEQKFLAGRRVDADGKRGNPGKGRAERIRILQILWRPNAKAAPHNIKCHNVSNVHGGQAQADYASTEKLAGAKTGESEGTAQAKVVGLARSIERFARRHRDDH